MGTICGSAVMDSGALPRFSEVLDGNAQGTPMLTAPLGKQDAVGKPVYNHTIEH
jgi:hypothetical protein